MAVKEQISAAPRHLGELARGFEPGGLVLFPDQISMVGKEEVAGFRPDAQALRVAALEQGVAVKIAAPEGARKGVYDEHAADWILPLLEVPPAVVATIIATYLQRRLDGWRATRKSSSPTVRYREIEATEGENSLRMREIEGSAEEVIEWLRDERGAQ